MRSPPARPATAAADRKAVADGRRTENCFSEYFCHVFRGGLELKEAGSVARPPGSAYLAIVINARCAETRQTESYIEIEHCEDKRGGRAKGGWWRGRQAARETEKLLLLPLLAAAGQRRPSATAAPPLPPRRAQPSSARSIIRPSASAAAELPSLRPSMAKSQSCGALQGTTFSSWPSY